MLLTMTQLTVIDESGSHSFERVGFGELGVSAGAFARATGWVLKPEGLCKEEICVPVRDATAMSNGDAIDVAEFARVTGRNVVIDTSRNVVAMGEQASNRAAAMATLDAPNFTLPDINGNSVSLSDFAHRKKLILAWSSW
ncbi:MAG: hypothetical protein ABR77_01890 [Acidimicrobiia bacterium BACL6 MAG-120322-bin79]|jgi:hypothetical protein|nr:MAG: hypothetical protein ABR77_01890 [Acidimicrobiia bacterium BACL6 MAG-120322-bin79]